MAEFIWPVRVYYEDTDAGGVVYYANYLKFLERARTEWLRARGIEQDRLRLEQGLIFVVRALSIDYLKPAHFNQLLEVSVEQKNRGKANLTLNQYITESEQGILCSAEVKIVCVDHHSLRPVKIPESFWAALN